MAADPAASRLRREDGKPGSFARQVLRVSAIHLGLALVALGCFIPWVTIAGRTRSGPALANLSLSLADLGFETPLSVFGYGWYIIPIAALALWVSLWRNYPPNPDRITIGFAAILLVVAVLFTVLVVRGPFLGSHPGPFVVVAGSLVTMIGTRFPRGKKF